jgi:hypothetical protein
MYWISVQINLQALEDNLAMPILLHLDVPTTLGPLLHLDVSEQQVVLHCP